MQNKKANYRINFELKIKTTQEMIEEYGLIPNSNPNDLRNININFGYNERMEKEIRRKNRTIKTTWRNRNAGNDQISSYTIIKHVNELISFFSNNFQSNKQQDYKSHSFYLTSFFTMGSFLDQDDQRWAISFEMVKYINKIEVYDENQNTMIFQYPKNKKKKITFDNKIIF